MYALKQYLGGNSYMHRTKPYPAGMTCAAAYKTYSKSPLNMYYEHTFLHLIPIKFGFALYGDKKSNRLRE